MGIVFNSVRKKGGGAPLQYYYWGVISYFENLTSQMRGDLTQNGPNMRIKCLIFLTEVYIIYFDNNQKLMLKYYTIYTHIYKKELNYNKYDLDFQRGFLSFKNIVWLFIRFKLTYTFLFVHKCLKQMFSNIKKHVLKSFYYTCSHAHRQLTFIVTLPKTKKWRSPTLWRKVNCDAPK